MSKKKKFTIVYKEIELFEPMRWLGFITGWKVSRAKQNWEFEASAFNNLVVKLAKKKPKKSGLIDWVKMASCMEESYKNQSEAIMLSRGQARARVVDMMETFGDYFI